MYQPRNEFHLQSMPRPGWIAGCEGEQTEHRKAGVDAPTNKQRPLTNVTLVKKGDS